MLGMMAVVILVLLIKVLPVFQQVFNQMGMEMNGISQGLLNAGNMISRYSSVFLIPAVLLIGCILFFSLTEKGHASCENWSPIFLFFVRFLLPWITAVWRRDFPWGFEADFLRKPSWSLQKN